ncbi:MAG: LL-diaminopimelate aminotransferase [Candidatus Omnitrophica bacterium]|nr:LL-diaminopimelate aminotransferase [Candidatus Omnitrophota bacterium]
MAFFLDESERLKNLPPYLFVEIDRAKRRAIEKGVRVIDFGVGDPDRPTPAFVLSALSKFIKNPATHHYPLDRGSAEFRRAAARWCEKRFGVTLDPDTEILPLIGSKEGIAHLPLAYLNPGDTALVPDPCYPPYKSGTLFAGGRAHLLPLREENGFLPDFEAVPAEILKKAKIIFVNYPNNPTGAVAPRAFYERLVAWGTKHKILIASDLAYSEIYLGNQKPLSIFEIPGGKETAIEFHSLSKTCNMTGWRVGFAAGRADAISALLRVKANLDSGVFTAIQLTAAEALRKSFGFSKKANLLYKRRRDLLVGGLRKLGFPVEPNPATFYVFTRLPGDARDSTAFCKNLLEKTGIVVTPGVGFGPAGEGYARFTLTVPEPQIREALSRMKKIF